MNIEPSKRVSAGATAFVDAGFESLLADVNDRIEDVREAFRKHLDSEKIDGLFESLCRTIRTARLEFEYVAKYYGADYEDQGQHFVDAVYYATDLAGETNYEEVKKSLKGHAEAVQALQQKMKAGQ